MKSACPRFEFRCIHYGDDTANTRELETHIERDEEDNITSCRKQEATSINARSCPYLIMLIQKQVGRRGSGIYGLVLGIRNDTHSHAMAVNPLRYKKDHVKTLPAFLPAIELGRSLRTAKTQPKLTDLDCPFRLAPMPLYVSQLRARLNFGSGSFLMSSVTTPNRYGSRKRPLEVMVNFTRTVSSDRRMRLAGGIQR